MSRAASARQSSRLRTLEPISSPMSQQAPMKDSIRVLSASSCSSCMPSASSTSTSTSE